MSKIQYVVGIDPGKSTGFAVYDRSTKKLIELKTLTFWKTVTELDSWVEDCGKGFEVFIENPADVSPTFKKSGVANRRAENKISQNVGSNKRDALLLMEYLEIKGIKFTPLSPRGRKMAKMDAEVFQRWCGWSESSSQHSRDAGALIYGR